MKKEVRALLPVWAAAMATALVLMILPPPVFEIRGLRSLFTSVAACVFMLTPLLLGALSAGHEFVQGTWMLSLSQPTRRSSMLAVRTTVLIAMGLALGLAFTAVVVKLAHIPVEPASVFRTPRLLLRPEILMPVVGGFLLAPWFTLVTRSVIAGALLALIVPAALFWALVLGIAFGWLPDVDVARTAWPIGTLVLALVAIWGVRRSFLGLQVAGSVAASDLLSVWRSGPRTARPATLRRSAYRSVLIKELHLQVPAIGLASLVAVLWLATAWVSGRPASWFTLYTVVLVTVIPAICGGSASAEERRLGVTTQQSMLPLAAHRQWLVKLGVTFSMSIALAVGLPVLLAAVGPTDVRVAVSFFTAMPTFSLMAVTALTTLALYFSSVSRSSLSAALLTGVSVLALFAVAPPTDLTIRRVVSRLLPLQNFPFLDHETAGLLGGSIALVVAFVTLRFAYRNHRSDDSTVGRSLAQVGGIYAAAVACRVVVQVVLHLTRS